MSKSEERRLRLEEYKTYFETHDESIKEVASKFKVKERTFRYYVDTYGWQRGVALKDIDLKDIEKDLKQGKNINLVKQDIKTKLKTNKEGLVKIYEAQTLSDASDEILLKAMSQSFIDKQIIKTALVGKSSFDILASIAEKPSDHAQLVRLSKDLVGMFSDVKRAIYGRDTDSLVNIINNPNITLEDASVLSDAELKSLLTQKPTFAKV
ncbi:hypothetical protein [Helicobacter sp. 11S02629-2]|uniref:hypothetical protein n=1 Tax=Helicobacter sp. 11S02629-2 TaxID=1476195 RepID=UPI000BA68991|nr:hypothetical protein [Helicobacter sp. 11S02629-2]PAF42758.1 hypothetical protein BKH40_07640 [Helicobacter sp. 11S02629-2]